MRTFTREQIAAYREGYDAAFLWASWTVDGAAFEASSLRSDLQPPFFSGYQDHLTEIAERRTSQLALRCSLLPPPTRIAY